MLDINMNNRSEDKSRSSWSDTIIRRTQLEVHQFEFEDIETTSQIRAQFFGLFAKKHVTIAGHETPILQVLCPRNYFPVLVCIVESVFQHDLDVAGILLSHFDADTGGIRMTLRSLLSAFPAIWDIVREDLCFCTKDLQLGLRFEVVYFDRWGRSASSGLFELSMWGCGLPKTLSWLQEWSGLDRLGDLTKGPLN